MKTMFISGGSNGIGLKTIELFINKGYRVINLDPREIKDYQDINILLNINNYIYISGKINNTADIKNAMRYLEEKRITIDTLVNNAGIFNGKGIKATVEDWEEILGTNLIGTFILTKEMLNFMNKDRSSIVNVASISGLIAQPNYLLYSASKAGIISMTKNLALDLNGRNIRVNSVSPSTVWTENNEYYINRDYSINKEEAGSHPFFGGNQIMKRVSDPEEIASAIFFLADSNAAGFITGQNIAIDGGYTTL